MSPMEVNENGDHDYKPPKKKTDDTEDKRKRKIVPGSLMKALIRPGAGEATPTDGDQVIYHCTIRTLDGVVVESSRSEFGGKGIAIRHVLGKSKMILGLLEGLTTMKKGEVAMFKMKPELHYGEDDCPVSVSDAFPKDAELHFETEMIDFSKVKVIAEDMGVLKKVIEEGEGWELPREPYEVKAWISAKTGDGKLIVSHTQGEPFFFTLGKFEVPKGLEMGIGTMSRGEKAVIYVTSQYLTQCSFLPLVEGIEEVHFEVELVHFIQVRDVLGDGRLIKRRIHDGKEPGQVLHAKRITNAFAHCRNLMLHSENAMNLFLSEFPMDCPLQDSLLRVHYKGMLLNDGRTIFYDTKVDNGGQPLEFSSGEGLVPEGFEMCVRLMLPEEIALVTCPPDYAYDKFPRPSNVPEGAHVQWEIELLSFEMQKDWTGMNFRSIMDDVEKTKGTGNRLFKEGKFELAKAKYEKVLREFKHVNPQDDEEGKEFLNTRNLLHLNVAACYLNMGMCRNSIDECNKVLDASPVHAKALYRRGLAYMAAGDFEEARSDFSKMMSIDKSSERNARAALLKLKQKEQEVKMKARKQFKGLFDKKPGEIAEAGTVDRGDQSDVDNSEKDNQDDTIRDKDDTEESVHVAAPLPRRMGLLSHLWSTSKNLFTALGVQRCTIL